MTITCWQIYRVSNCQHAKPDPKDKFVLIVSASAGEFYGVFINSDIRGFIRNNGLMVCEVQIHRSQHAFLQWDSWIDCTNVYRFNASELTDYLCDLSISTRADVLGSIQACPALKNIYKNKVLGT